MKSGSRRFLIPALVGIGVVLTSTGLVAIHRAQLGHAQTRAVVENLLASIEDVSRLGRDIDQRRLLVYSHIFEHEAVPMTRVEQQIARVDDDYAATAAAYDSLAVLPGERIAWAKLKSDIASIQAPMGEAIWLSRRNEDTRAKEVMLSLSDQFTQISDDTAILIHINRAEVAHALAQVRALQRSSTVFIVGLLCLGLILTSVVGVWASSLVLQQEDELRRHSLQLEDQNRELDAFAGRVAHDLRGPLSAIHLAASTLAQPDPESAGSQALRRGVQRMEVLIEDLLALSRIGAQSRGAVCDPALSAAQVADELAPRLQSGDVRLRMAVGPARVRCRESLLRQALWNLADNAVKYRRAGVRAEIEIRGEISGERYQLQVSDNGIGMSPDEAGRAFDPFYRAPRSRDAPGTGLGLSIVKRVVEASGGAVSIESQPGRGTTFVLTLPLAHATA